MNIIKLNSEGHKVATPVTSKEAYLKIRNSLTNRENLMKAHQGDDDAKRRLVQFNYNDLLPDGKLAGCSHPSSYFAGDVDCEGLAVSKEIAQRFLDHKDEIQLMELSRSAHFGLHYVCRRQMGRTILENQVRVAQVTKTEMDTSAHDLQRVMFTVTADSDELLYLDEAIFQEPLTIEESEREYELLKQREQQGLEEVPAGAKKANKHYRPWEDKMYDVGCQMEDVKTQTSNPSPQTSKSYKGIPYADIISEFWRQTGGEPIEGERNVRLHQLAVNLRTICDNNPQTLMAVMPRLGLSEVELQQIVNSACKDQPKGITNLIKQITSKITHGSTQKEPSLLCNSEDGIDAQLWEWGRQIESMFDDFPLLREVCEGLKPNQYPAAFVVAAGVLMTLMTRCTYRHYHQPLKKRRLNCSALIIGDPASGKSFATDLYKVLAEPIVKADRPGKDILNNWREETQKKSANKEGERKPKVLIREHPARTSNATFITDMINAKEVVDGKEVNLHMITFDSELDNTISMQKGGSWIDKTSMELKAFHNEEDGQAYSNKESIQDNFIVTWNYIYTGTPMALKHKVNERNFGSGQATRLTVVPMPSTNFEMLDYDEDMAYEDNGREDRMREWAYKLDRMKGELNTKALVRELYDWTKRRMLEAKENSSKAEEMLLKRCSFHALNMGLPFIVMRHWDQMHQDGTYWCGDLETDEVDWQLCEMIVNMQYACQRHYFLSMAEKYFDDQQRDVSANMARKQRTVEAFNSLPEVFTNADVEHCFGYKEGSSSARTKTRNLLKDGLIEFVEEFTEDGKTKYRYRKTGVML